MTSKFSPGKLIATPNALEELAYSGQTQDFFLGKHVRGDWGDIGAEDWQANEQALVDGGRLLSTYKTLKGVKLWIITDAEDDDGHRAATTILLPDEY